MSVWRPEFEAALAVFAAISDEMAAHGAQRPILVGGAAVEMYTGSAMVTGDFDIVTGRHDLIDTLFREHGFVPRPILADAAGSIPNSPSASKWLAAA